MLLTVIETNPAWLLKSKSVIALSWHQNEVSAVLYVTSMAVRLLLPQRKSSKATLFETFKAVKLLLLHSKYVNAILFDNLDISTSSRYNNP